MLGLCGGRPVECLVDSGATHSFIAPAVIKRLKLLVKTALPLNVTVADGSV